MQLTSTLVALSALALGTTNANPLEARVPLMGYFHISTTAACPLVLPDFYKVGLPMGPDDPSCRRFPNNITYAAISVDYWNPKCLITLFNTLTCTDDGIVSGTGGCWWPDGGIKGYKATCPYRD